MPDYLISSGIADLPTGLPDKEAGLVTPLYRAVSNLAQQLATLTGNVQYSAAELAVIDQLTGLIGQREQRIAVKAGEALGYGQLLTLTVVGGRITANIATALDVTKPAHAICDAPSGIANGADGLAVFMTGRCAGVVGTTLGTTYYLGVAGAMTATAPTADSVLNQIVAIGLGTSGTYLQIEPVGKRVTRTYKTSGANLRTQYTDGTFTDATV
jgi:hypothetical protein